MIAQVRPGGMERPQDDYKLTNNMKLLPRDTLFGGQVSRLQVAELIGAAVADTDIAENKVRTRKRRLHKRALQIGSSLRKQHPEAIAG